MHLTAQYRRLPPVNTRGFTLVELLVVLVILGFIASMSAFAVAGLRLPESGKVTASTDRARAKAIGSGRAVTIRLLVAPASAPRVLRFLPDGRAVGEGLDPLTGRWIEGLR